MDMDTELWKCTAAELAGAVRRGEISAAEVTESHLARIAEVNPAVNAVTQLLADHACRDAEELDRQRRAGQRLGPLAGVPFTVKENIGIGGVPTTHGIARFQQMVAAQDAPPVARLRAAGAIPIGHSNMPDLTLVECTRAVSCSATPPTPGTPAALRAAPAAATVPRWRPAWHRSAWATTLAARCASRPPSAARPA
jgi:Asp-tRNA(Asn)/Glu-tRNA(Gln) amidotransferase A subunit family amidase